MVGNDEGPSPLVPSIMLGVFGIFKYGPSIVSYLSFFVEILEGLTGGGDEDEEGEEGGEEGPVSSILFTLCCLCFLVIILLMLVLFLQKTSRLYRQDLPEVPWRLSSGSLNDWIYFCLLIFLVIFIVDYNNLM
ncbi:hypothetical protein MLD38_037342 [Melastoma candidum]|uniref:Uncharacterized protein n=1 Tax=Melastoma candidum TaxID=119954 RepID=A0ACB9LMG9_9MYRT|nr:hypothetical protein MLD38_037342 [Melastoma candidum]